MKFITLWNSFKFKFLRVYKHDKSQKFLFSTIPTIIVYGIMFNLLLFSFGIVSFNLLYIISLGFLWVFLYEDFTTFINKMKG